ncbi:ExbD/TolR family protein [Tundrisphaera sp. TA3]|uniref:ExbD/TolR family protein n=1 Tax=Tundrisphaera sp. TA3 TaxID=3435775 RepID=UPI003EBFA153
MRRRFWAGAGLLGLFFAANVRADELDRIDGRSLLKALGDPEARAVPSLTVPEIAAMPAVFRDTRSAFLLARTDRGNPARMLVVPELRRPNSGEGEPIPVLVLERVDSFDAGEPGTRLAHSRDLVLFDGFRVDLDSGHIVPEGQGEDLIFRAGGDGGPRLEVVGASKLFPITRPPKSDSDTVHRPTPGRVIVPRDFSGRYRLFANGQWSGPIELKVDAGGVVTGHFTSDLNGSRYPVTGQVAGDRPGHLLFAVGVPRARLEFDGLLFGEGKGAIAGTVSLVDRTFGFFAIRDGGRIAPSGHDVAPLASDDANEAEGRHVVAISGEEISLDGKKLGAEALGGSLRALIESEPQAWILIETDKDQPMHRVWLLVEEIRRAGVGTVRLRMGSVVGAQ